MSGFHSLHLIGRGADLEVTAATDYTERVYLRLNDDRSQVTISGDLDEIEDFAARVQRAVDNLTSELDARVEAAS